MPLIGETREVAYSTQEQAELQAREAEQGKQSKQKPSKQKPSKIG